MSKLIPANLVNNVVIGAKKALPEILTGLGVIGMGSAVALAIYTTTKAVPKIENKKKELNKEKLTKKETVETVWKDYIPVVTTVVISGACIIGADAVHMKRNMGLAAACALYETNFKEYKSKVVETIGEKKEKSIRESIAKDKMENHPVSEVGVIMTGAGNTLFFDTISGRYFRSDVSVVQKAEQYINRKLRDEMYVSYNEMCYEVGLPQLTIIGDEIGWNVSDGWIDMEFGSQLASDNTPCIVIDYFIGPRTNYRDC